MRRSGGAAARGSSCVRAGKGEARWRRRGEGRRRRRGQEERRRGGKFGLPGGGDFSSGLQVPVYGFDREDAGNIYPPPPFVPAGGSNRDKRHPFCPGFSHRPGQIGGGVGVSLRAQIWAISPGWWDGPGLMGQICARGTLFFPFVKSGHIFYFLNI